MEPIMLLLLSISILGIFVIFGISHFNIENNVVNHINGGNQNFNSFMAKVKNNSVKIRH